MLAIRQAVINPAAIVITSSVVFQNIFALTIPKALRAKLNIWIPFTVGATGGIRARLDGAGSLGSVSTTILLFNTVAPSVTSAFQTAIGTAFTNALANAGNHWLKIEATVENTNVAPAIIAFDMAQNTSDALSLTIREGAIMELTETN